VSTGKKVSRWVVGTGIAGTVFIAGLAFWLSFTALRHLAIRAGIAEQQAWAWPLIVDGIIVVATVAVVALRQRKGQKYSWLLLISGALVSVTANAIQAAMPAGMALPAPLAAAVSAVPPIVLLAITHLTVVLARHEDQTTEHEPEPSSTTISIAPQMTPAPTPLAVSSSAMTDKPSATPLQLPQGQEPDPSEETPALPAAPSPTEAASEHQPDPDLDDLSEEELHRLLLGIDATPPPEADGTVGEPSRTYLVEEAKRLKQQGLSNRAIGEQLGVDATTVGRWLKKREPGD